jgi:hypothetical protein
MRSLVRIADYALDAQTHVIEVEGQIDLYAAPLLNERVHDVTDQGRPHLILDLSVSACCLTRSSGCVPPTTRSR